MSEVVWRNHTHKKNVYNEFFSLLTQIYDLQGPPKITYKEPLFDTWTPPAKEDEVKYNFTILQDSDESSSDEELLSSVVSVTPADHQASTSKSKQKQTEPDEVVIIDSSDEETMLYIEGEPHRHGHPVNFVPLKKFRKDNIEKHSTKGKGPAKKRQNPYGKGAYQYSFSSDSDFQ